MSRRRVVSRRAARRWMVRLGTALAIVVLQLTVTAFGAPPASAHSTLESTDPVQGSRVSRAPARVSLHFSQGVAVSQDSVHVIDAAGQRVDSGTARHSGTDDATVVIDLRADLPNGSYAVLWHVVSADSHPVSGTFSFGVGVPAGAAPPQAPADAAVQDLHWVLQGLWYVGAALVLGTSLFVALLWPEGGLEPRTRQLIRLGVVAAGVAAAGLYLVQGPYGQERGLGALTDLGLLRDTLATNSGPLFLLRLLVIALAIPLLGLRPRRRGPHLRPALIVATVLSLVTALGGHAGQASPVPVSVVIDAVHLLAAAVWLGGLACLAWTVLPRAEESVLRRVLPAWSRLALGAVGALVVTGAYQGWRQVGSLGALTGTDYGRLLLAKVSGLLVLLVLAAAGRAWVRSHSAQQGPAPVGRLRRSVLAEVAAGGVVLMITAALVSTAPARQAYTPPFSATVLARGVDSSAISVVLDVPVTRPGPEAIHLYTYTVDGTVQDFTRVDGTLLDKRGGIGPVRFTFLPISPGHAVADHVVVPSTGTWTLTVQVTTGPSTDYAASVSYPVRSG